MITPIEAASSVSYLIAAGCTTARDGQGTVWADYINHEIANATSAELIEATRAAIRAWSEMRRTYQVDVEHVTDAIRRIRRKRLRDMGEVLPRGLEDEPMQERAWLNAFREAGLQGLPRVEAEAQAWRTINRTPPPVEPPDARRRLPRRHSAADTAPSRPTDARTPPRLGTSHTRGSERPAKRPTVNHQWKEPKWQPHSKPSSTASKPTPRTRPTSAYTAPCDASTT